VSIDDSPRHQPGCTKHLEHGAGKVDAVRVCVHLGPADAEQVDGFLESVRRLDLDPQRLAGESAPIGDLLRVDRATKPRAGRHGQLFQRIGRKGAGHIEGLLVRPPVQHMGKQRVRHHARIRREHCPRHRASVQRPVVKAFRERRDLHQLPVMARRHPHQLQEAPKPDGDLPVEGVGVRQELRGIDVQRHYPRLAKVHQPGLPVVRVRRKQGIAQRAVAGILALPRLSPRQAGSARLAGGNCTQRRGGGKNHAASDQGKGLAAGQGHGGLLCDTISHYMIRNRITCNPDLSLHAAPRIGNRR
jgi:hypothetical protein